jgi:HNH endonuclease
MTFWSKVERGAPGECWLWTGATTKGYGRFRGTGAHRFAYELLVGPIPQGLQLDHLCRVRNCVNPEHLEPVTCQENLRRGFIAKARAGQRPTHCPQGHEFTTENTYIWRGNKRACKTCNGIRALARYHRKRALAAVPPEETT